MGLFDNIKKGLGDAQQSILKVGGDVQQNILKVGGDAQQSIIKAWDESSKPIWDRGSTLAAVKDLTNVDDKVVEWVRSDPIKAAETVKNPLPQIVEQLQPKSVDEQISIIKDAAVPIWDRGSTKKLLGEEGAAELENNLNPIKWVENVDIPNIIPDLIPEQAKTTVKQYLPAVAIGAAALLLISALK